MHISDESAVHVQCLTVICLLTCLLTCLPACLPACQLTRPQVPKDMVEADIEPLFSAFGTVENISIIRNPATQIHKGCAFVTFKESAAALAAIDALHDKHLLGSVSYLERESRTSRYWTRSVPCPLWS